MWRKGVCNIELFQIADINENSLLQLFGEPGAESDEYDDAPGPAKYWYLEYSCGLKLILQWHATTDFVIVYADKFEHAHVQRHLASAFAFDDAWSNQPHEMELTKLIKFYPHLASYFGTDKNWFVERLDDNANIFTVEENLTERAARCIAASLEATGHKQSYEAKQKRTLP